MEIPKKEYENVTFSHFHRPHNAFWLGGEKPHQKVNSSKQTKLLLLIKVVSFSGKVIPPKCIQSTLQPTVCTFSIKVYHE